MHAHAPDVQIANIRAMLTELDDTIDRLRSETRHAILVTKDALNHLNDTLADLVETGELKTEEARP